MTNSLKKHIYHSTHFLPLAIYRMAFGFLMCFSQIRFICKGWVNDCYISPEYHFTYLGFDWVQPFENPLFMYGTVVLCALSALFIGLGFLYRTSSVFFLLSFTYLELIEKSWYLNHYYFVSLVALLLCLIPAHKNYSIDSKLFPSIKTNQISAWCINIFKLQITFVYFFAGIAKIKSDWIFNALPLNIWLKAKSDLPIIGSLLQYDTTAYLFSWFGLSYDLLIAFFLWNKRTRPYALVTVIIFHTMTAVLFNIGMFPWVMIMGSLIFITVDEWQKVLKIFKINISKLTKSTEIIFPKWKRIVLILFFIIQIYLPLRHYFYNENMMWTERYFRFGWNVMLMEKNGYCEFIIIDKKTGKKWTEYPSKHLSIIQEKQMSFQPDMIWQYAKYLNEKYSKNGVKDCEVYVNSRVSLNGRPSQVFINPKTNLIDLKNMNAIYDEVLEMK